MIVTHSETTHALCPVQAADVDYYDVEFSVGRQINVELLREVLARHRGNVIFQEDLTQLLADQTGCTVTTRGRHRTTATVVTCNPR